MRIGEINLIASCVWIVSAGIAAGDRDPILLCMGAVAATAHFWLFMEDNR
jgi:hypothetical protein